MHAKIREFPSNQFYNGKLEDAQIIQEREKDPDFKFGLMAKNFGRTTFFDLQFSREEQHPGSTSFFNISEVNFTFNLIETYLLPMNKPMTIGVVTPYKAHQILLQSEWQRKRIKLAKDVEVKFKTVDAFQGQEKDIIIFNCVRANYMKKYGFLKDKRRLNVAITRPRYFLFIVGNSETVKHGEDWRGLVNMCKKSDLSFKQFKT